jgi:hypothetical protein
MYTEENYRTKKQLKEAIKNGAIVRVFQPGPFGSGKETGTRTVYLEGPHFVAHTWYAQGKLVDGKLVSVK